MSLDLGSRFNATGLPPQAAAELAVYLRNSIYEPLNTNITRLSEEYEESINVQKNLLQDVQSQISGVIEPTAEKLVPIAEDLKDVYHQIDLLEALVFRTGENIKQMTAKVEKTEQAVRREEKALNEGKPLAMWGGSEPIKIFSATDYVDNGRLKESPPSPPPASMVERSGTPRQGRRV